MIDFSEMALEVLKENPSGLHVNDMARLIIERYQNLQIDIETLSSKLSAKLSLEIKTKKSLSRFSK
ncbi:hypothetical protein FORC55_1124 [Vibrio cholerae]|nr:hypothetical protein FORC55_1124 [Vibrio cholerae]